MKPRVTKGNCPHCTADRWLVKNTFGEVIACWNDWNTAMLLANLLGRAVA